MAIVNKQTQANCLNSSKSLCGFQTSSFFASVWGGVWCCRNELALASKYSMSSPHSTAQPAATFSWWSFWCPLWTLSPYGVNLVDNFGDPQDSTTTCYSKSNVQSELFFSSAILEESTCFNHLSVNVCLEKWNPGKCLIQTSHYWWINNFHELLNFGDIAVFLLCSSVGKWEVLNPHKHSRTSVPWSLAWVGLSVSS